MQSRLAPEQLLQHTLLSKLVCAMPCCVLLYSCQTWSDCRLAKL